MTVDDFKNLIARIESEENYQQPYAYGLGVRRSKNGKTMDVTFPLINVEAHLGAAAVIADAADLSGNENGFAILETSQLEKAYNGFACFHDNLAEHPNLTMLKAIKDSAKNSAGYADVDVILYFLHDKSQAVETVEEAYFKLQMLSQRLAKPHTLCLDSMFGVLNNIAWSNYGPILPEDLDKARIAHLFDKTPLAITHVDKFPYLVNYHLPSGVRIASGSQVRLGAYLGDGSTVMPAGYVNFNAGTEGNAMIEGRVSAGVFVGSDTDVGGGASIMGTLSGGNDHVISIGEKCLLGANAGTGISLGFGCTIAAGLYVYGGMKVALYNAENQPVDIDGDIVAEGANTVKAVQLSGRDKMLFIQDSQSGKLICKPNPKTIELNAQLHSN